MTIVVVGHQFRPIMSFTPGSAIQLEPKHLFAVADSAITTPSAKGLQLILSGFRKIYSVPIVLWKPYFVGEQFRGYKEEFRRLQCLVAIAGSTLTAQHVLNSIQEHLAKLRISYESTLAWNKPGKYKVVRHCAGNELEDRPDFLWGEDMFLASDMEGLLTGSVIAEVVEYSIREALTSARQYKLDKDSLHGMRSEYALGVYCPVAKTHRLFTFKMDFVSDKNGVYQVEVDQAEIAKGNVAVLGMRNKEPDAQAAFDASLANNHDPASAMFDFVNKIIETEKTKGNSSVDFPSALFSFDQGVTKLEKKRRRDS